MNIEQFLTTNREGFIYCNIKLNNKSKIPVLPKNYRTWSEQKIKKYNDSEKDKVEYIIHTTNSIHILDVDNMDNFNKYFEKFNLLNSPHYLSITKKLPHIFIKINNLPSIKKEWLPILNTCDIMTGQRVYCKKGENIINYNNEILTIDYNDIININENIKNEEKQSKELNKKNKKICATLEKKKIKEELKNEENQYIKKVCKYDIIYDNILLNLLTVKIVDDYKNWVNIGYAIYNKYGDDGLNMYHMVSSISPDKYNHDETNKQYEYFKTSKGLVNFGSIVEMLKSEPKLYKYYTSLLNFKLLGNGLNDEAMTGMYISNLYKDTYFLCGNIKNPILYIYNNGVYELVECAIIELRKLILKFSLDVNNDYYNIIKINNIICTKNNLEEEKKALENIINRLHRFTCWSSSTKFNDNMVTHLQINLYHRDFEKKLNTDPNILGFGEYVYDLKKYEFRKATQKDYISIKVGVTKEEVEKASTKRIMPYLDSVFPTEEQKEFILELTSDVLLGRTGQVFNVWLGSGGNSKSVFQNILKVMMNEYFEVLDSDCITMSNSNNNILSQLASIRWARCVFISEPDDQATINISKLRSLASDDPKKAKQLYKNAYTFVPACSLFILCNNKIKMVSPDDDSIPRRLRFNNFSQTFVSEDKYEELKQSGKLTSNHQILNGKVSKQKYIKKLAIELMALLLKVYKQVDTKYTDRKIAETKTSLIHKAEFIKSNDPFQDFLDETYIITNNKSDVTLLTDIIPDYNSYCITNHCLRLNKKDILNKLIHLHGINNYKKRLRIYDDKNVSFARNGFINIKKKAKDTEEEYDITINTDKDGNYHVVENIAEQKV